MDAVERAFEAERPCREVLHAESEQARCHAVDDPGSRHCRASARQPIQLAVPLDFILQGEDLPGEIRGAIETRPANIHELSHVTVEVTVDKAA
ncbi:hypothetical protein [Rhizobium lusitanum]|uniref:Uncharacterized protein n=1 Tax=Rhizobium lusitanum TaxID=293958 RepID=A0A7X0ILC9_9HYPH|nr:hypothetical protein [Rhizobium lusitanum]MBB6483124.1 hypothetical protein [Rhizobium lusitanum]